MTATTNKFSRAKTAAVRFLREEEGASAVEYGLLASLIAAAILGVVTTLGNRLKGTFNFIQSGMQN